MEPAAETHHQDEPPPSRPKDSGGSRATLIAVIGLAVAAVALVLALMHEREDKADSAVTAPLPQVTAPPPASSPAPALQRDPSFDVVRIGGDGNSVIAGRALPGAVVSIIDGTTELGKVTADARGEWVFVPSGPLPPGSRELRLEARNPDGSVTTSGDPVVLVVPEPGKGPALAIQTNRKGGSRLLQGPSGTNGLLSLDVVDHDDQNRLFVGGKTHSGGKVFLYLDNKLIGKADADADGNWRVESTRPEGHGRHTLRADLIGDKGKVLARVEVIWAPGEDLAMGSAGIVVAPGNSLWRIARKMYGRGVAYTVIFEANRDRIKDPDLIYPGQVFSVPVR